MLDFLFKREAKVNNSQILNDFYSKLKEKYSKKPSLIIAKIPHLDDKEFHAKLVHKLQFTDITSV